MYLPQQVDVHNTTFPTVGLDTDTLGQFLIEMWTRFYPTIPYYQIDVVPTTPNIPPDKITGVAGKTLVDDLWGEESPTTTWQQPHSATDSPVANAVEGRKFLPLVNIPTHIYFSPEKSILKKYGIEENIDSILIWPLVLLDNYSVIVSNGDTFLWRNVKYEVLQSHTDKFFYKTGFPLYLVATANRWREGS